MCYPSHRIAINNKMAKFYPSEYKDTKSNIYTKKVCAQLFILKKDYPEIYSSKKLLEHFGNDEISDSYLLDMITPDDVHCKIWKAMGQGSNRLNELSSDMIGSTDFYNKYINLKQECINKHYSEDFVRQQLGRNLQEQERLISEVVSACDFRTMLVSAYQNHGGKEKLGKDLFIGYVSVMKEMWEHEHDMASYEHFIYMANNVYTSLLDIVDQEFNQFRDTTLHGNVLKSDVFKFVVWTNIKIYAEIYKVTIMPKPIELKIYSLNSVVNGLNQHKRGGAGTILGGYIQN